VPHLTGSSNYFTYSGLESGTGILSTTTPQPIGKKGLYIQFPTNFSQNPDAVWVISLPNPKSAQYLSAYNAYQTAVQARDSALSTAQSQINERKADLALRKAAARPAEVDVVEAGVLTAQAQLASAQVAYDKTILRAPAAGTIVHVDTKIGERVDAQKKVMVLQDVTNLYVEANINETSIAKVAVGQDVTMTLDAFGPEKLFTGKVIHVDPSATTENGIVNYKVKASIDLTEDLKNAVRPGMNANMVIVSSQTPGVVAIPQAAITTTGGVSTVNVITNAKRQKYEARTITTGAEGDGNLIEVKTGLVDGDSLALVAKK
jgi:RND family efflux transporter MFP subunit